jgi:hypothetical protein
MFDTYEKAAVSVTSADYPTEVNVKVLGIEGGRIHVEQSNVIDLPGFGRMRVSSQRFYLDVGDNLTLMGMKMDVTLRS